MAFAPRLAQCNTRCRLCPGLNRKLRFGGRERERKRGPLFRLSFAPDASVVPMDDPLDRGQADARSIEFCRGMQPLERSEELIRISHVESGPIVPDIIGSHSIFSSHAEFYFCV